MYMTKERTALIERAIISSGFDKRELLLRMWHAAWGPEQLEREILTDGWIERLDRAAGVADIERALLTDEAVRGSIAKIFTRGPSAMAALPADERLTRIPSKLRWVAETYEPRKHGGLAILGATGTLKTFSVVHAVVRIASAQLEGKIEEAQAETFGAARDIRMRVTHAPSIAWFRATDIGKARRETPLGKGEAPLVVEAMNAAVAVLDDVGWEGDRDTAIAEIVAERYDAKRPTIVTSGLRPEQVEERYGAAFLRRIVDGEIRGRIISLFPVALSVAR